MSISTGTNGNAGSKRIGARSALRRIEELDFKKCSPREAYISLGQLQMISASPKVDEITRMRAEELKVRLNREAEDKILGVRRCSSLPPIPEVNA